VRKVGTKSRISFVVSVLDTRIGRESTEWNASVGEISFEGVEVDVDKVGGSVDWMNNYWR